jgi:hypothetical protein
LARYCFYCKSKLNEDTNEDCSCNKIKKVIYGDIIKKGSMFICGECKSPIIHTIYKTDFDTKILMNNKCGKCGAKSYLEIAKE